MAKKYPADQIAQELVRGISSVQTKAHEARNIVAPNPSNAGIEIVGIRSEG
jgi:hypothetical protein